MKRIYVLVEGQTEKEFVSRLLSPYFGQQGLSITPIPMLKSGGGIGFSNLEHFKNNVKPLLYEADRPLITTLVDLYRFPVHSSSPKEVESLQIISADPDPQARLNGFGDILTAAVQQIRPYEYFIPYIQKYEFEALLFADSEAFGIENAEIQKDVEGVLTQISEPEEINSTETGHPAHRLEDIFSKHKRKYEKGADAVDIAELIGIETILEKCPRFRQWIEVLITQAQK